MLEIRQHGKTLWTRRHCFAAFIDEDLVKEAQDEAATLRSQGVLETGYYDLVLIDGNGRERDSEILIA